MKQANDNKRLARETMILSIFSVSLQGFGLLLNIFLTERLGSASVGVITLIGSFYSLASVLSGGSGFIAASRFISEEIGCNGNPQCVFRYVLSFCLMLSSCFSMLLCILAPRLIQLNFISNTQINSASLRLIAISLPLSAGCACLKGRCYAFHRVYLPAIAECIEFLIRAAVMAFCTVFFIPIGKITILGAFAIAAAAGQGTALCFLSLFQMTKSPCRTSCTIKYRTLIRYMLPIIGNACLVSLLSTANDALVPLTLLQFGDSAKEALSKFGEFEAIIIPTLFFPSVVQCCMSGLLVPELSKARANNNSTQIRIITEHVLEQTVSFSFFIVLLLILFGDTIGKFLGGDAFAGHILKIMAPIVPFLYLEIIMEGILRGLGKQSFSSVNYLAEYIVRISVLLICVPLFGFYGIVMSYIACNLSGNAVRTFFVLRLTNLKPNWKHIVIYPLVALIAAWQTVQIFLRIFGGRNWNPEMYFIVFSILCGCIMMILLRLIHTTTRAKSVNLSSQQYQMDT